MRKYYGLSRMVMICLSLGLLAGCDIRRTMGIESKPSDEFVVSPAQKELEVPPHFELLPPQAGNSGQDISFPLSQGGSALEAAPAQKPLTPSEKEMIKQLGPGLGLSDQTKMDGDALKAEDQSQKKGLFGRRTKNKASQGEILDPYAEEKKLQSPQPTP